MTVCIAALFQWAYPDGTRGRAVLTASDRMLTAGQIEYEPPQFKMGALTRRAVVLISGSYAVHSEALLRTQRQLAANPEDDIEKIANLYGAAIARYKARQAEALYLSPLGLTMDSFISRQKEITPQLAGDLAAQMQGHRIEAEAIIAGCDDAAGHIYHVDADGFATCHDDGGFVSIGLGTAHANSQFMLLGYASWWAYPQAVLLTYSAKKRAEVAPGVGNSTDMYLVTKTGIEPLRTDVMNKVAQIIESEQKRNRERLPELIEELVTFIKAAGAPAKDQPASGTPETAPSIDASAAISSEVHT